jgi:hypothetical protein
MGRGGRERVGRRGAGLRPGGVRAPCPTRRRIGGRRSRDVLGGGRWPCGPGLRIRVRPCEGSGPLRPDPPVGGAGSAAAGPGLRRRAYGGGRRPDGRDQQAVRRSVRAAGGLGASCRPARAPRPGGAGCIRCTTWRRPTPPRRRSTNGSAGSSRPRSSSGGARTGRWPSGATRRRRPDPHAGQRPRPATARAGKRGRARQRVPGAPCRRAGRQTNPGAADQAVATDRPEPHGHRLLAQGESLRREHHLPNEPHLAPCPGPGGTARARLAPRLTPASSAVRQASP